MIRIKDLLPVSLSGKEELWVHPVKVNNGTIGILIGFILTSSICPTMKHKFQEVNVIKRV